MRWLLGCLSFCVMLFTLVGCSSVDGWSKLQLSPEIFASMPFAGFLINIYEHQRNNITESNLKRYYYAPLSLLNRTSPSCVYNNVTDEHTVNFVVHMWTNEESLLMLDFLQPITGFKLKPHQLRIIPIERVALKSTRTVEKFGVSTEWEPYFNQPEKIGFVLFASDQSACEVIAKQLKNYPNQFHYLHLYFAMGSPNSERKETTVTLQNVRRSRLLQQLQRQFVGHDVVYLTTSDEQKLLSESSRIIFTETFDDDKEIPDENEEQQIWDEVKQMLSITQTSSKTFDAQAWKSVYWRETEQRPDKMADNMNDIFNRNVGQLSSNDEVTPSIVKWSDEMEELKRKGQRYVEWTGQKFVPKALTLTKVNLAAIYNTSIRSRTLRVRYSTSVLRTNINYIMEAGAEGADGRVGTDDFATKGESGYSGQPGIPGTPGLPGYPGVKGNFGEPGINGMPGTKGDRGEAGYPGLSGLPGLRGPHGERGEKCDSFDPPRPSCPTGPLSSNQSRYIRVPITPTHVQTFTSKNHPNNYMDLDVGNWIVYNPRDIYGGQGSYKYRITAFRSEPRYDVLNVFANRPCSGKLALLDTYDGTDYRFPLIVNSMVDSSRDELIFMFSSDHSHVDSGFSIDVCIINDVDGNCYSDSPPSQTTLIF